MTPPVTLARHIYDVPLRPVLGSTFQPTGFPDVGAATFDRFDDGGETLALLVESVQSMANRLEGQAWDRANRRPHDTVDGLPYVEVVRAKTGDFLTTSRLEAHRLASPFVHEATLDGSKMADVIGQRLSLAKDTPLDYPSMARAVFGLDPFCLLHGVFFSQKFWLGQPKFPRAISAVIEASDVRRAISGGRKSDSVRHQLDKDEQGGGTAEGYGSVPFHRVEWTAKRIVASFVIDLELISSYGLPGPAAKLLETIALWEIRSLLSGGLRLRTACDLEMNGAIETRRGEPLPDLDETTARIRDLTPQCNDLINDGVPLTVQWGKG